MINKNATIDEYTREETMKLMIKTYDKGINDAFDVLKEGFVTLKERGFKSFDIDTIITMVETCREQANKIPTTYEV